MRGSLQLLALAAGLASARQAVAQAEKEVDQQAQVWVSLNSTTRLNDRWGVVGDFHLRRTDFLSEPSFDLLRFGAHFWLSEKLTLTAGYAHNWIAPEEPGSAWIQEDRLYQQMQYATPVGSARVLHRFRNELRWKDGSFSDRVRYLASLTVPVSKSPSVPSLVFSDEILVQFGHDVVANTFDQNRLFAGIKKGLGRDWSFDLGYMLVYQQLSSYQYDLNHTLRWFFYYTPDFRKPPSSHDPASNEE